MGTKSYVKPICNPRVPPQPPKIQIREISFPKEDAKVGKVAAIRIYMQNEIEKLEKIANKLYNELSQEDLEKIKELCNSCDDFHDDH